MKILTLSNFYPPDLLGGYELGCKQAVDALIERGHTVRVLTTASRSPAPQVPHVDRGLRLTDLFSDFVNRRSTLSATRLMDAEAFRLNAFNVDRLFLAIEELQPDVVYVWNLLGLGGLGLLAALQHRRVPWVWHLMDDVPLVLCRYNSPGPNRLIMEVARQLRGSFLACSKRLVDEIEAGGIPVRPRVEILPNWVVGRKKPAKAPYRPGETLRIVSAGRITPDKGIGILIDAALLLRERGIENFQLDFFGQLRDWHYPTMVKHHGLERHVRFLGALNQEDLADRFAEYDVFGFPTFEREPFGFAPLEAATRGCVPVISHLCGIAEWLVDGVHCLKAARTPEAFADKFEQIYTGAIDTSEIARRAYNVAWRDFHINTLIPRVEQELHKASTQSRDGAGTIEEFHRLAIIAERLTRILVQEGCAA